MGCLTAWRWPLASGALLAALAAATPARCAESAALAPALLQADADQVLSRIVVPDPARRVGEVRLLSRAGAVVVQTLLSTKVLARVVGEIRKKEESAWPPGSRWHADSERYLGALQALQHELESRRTTVAWAERRYRALIEFIADDSSAGVVVGTWDGREVDGALEPTARSASAPLALGRDYVLRNMRLILIDSFHMADADLERLGALGPLRGVAASAPAATPPPPGPALPPADRDVSR